MSQIHQDLRFALRRLRKNPAFTATTVLILALGLGATTALFSVVHAVLLSPLPYPEAERIYRLVEFDLESGVEEEAVSSPTFHDWHTGLESFSALAAHHFDNFNLTGAREPQQLRAARVNQDFFDVFGPLPRPGRAFTVAENSGEPAPVVLLGHRIWQRQFAGRDEVIGSAITLDGKPHTVLGVMPEGFQFPAWADLWLPLGERSEIGRDQRDVAVYGLLEGDVDRDAAAAELATMARRLSEAHPATHEGFGTKMRSLLEERVGEVRPTLLALFGAVFGVLLIVCLNVAGLQLARGLEQRRELALRSALGAGRGRVMRQLLTESVVLAGIGGTAGILLAHWSLDLILALAPSGVPRLGAARIDAPVLAFALGATLLSGIVAGFLPALSSTRFRLDEALRTGSQRAGSGRAWGPRGVLVVAQVTLTVVLLAAAGLMISSLQKLLALEPGFDAARVASVGLVLPPDVYPEGHQRAAFIDQVQERLEVLPEVEKAAAGNALPWTGFPGLPLRAEATRRSEATRRAPGAVAGSADAYEKIGTASLFETLGVPLLAGRPFRDGDEIADGGIEEVVINELLARRVWPERFAAENVGPPLGERLALTSPGKEPITVEVVGIAANLPHGGLTEPLRPQVFRSYSSYPWNYVNVAVRASGAEPAALLKTMREAIWELDPDRPIFGESTAAMMLEADLEQPRFGALLLGAFAVVALVLAAVGVYGLMAFVVGRRGREIGIRMALGAQRAAVRLMVLRQGMMLVGAGLLLGIPASFAAARWLESQLFGVEPGEPLVFAAALSILALAAGIAVLLPASRASRIEPVVALREE